MIEICKIYTIKVITNGQRQFESWSTALSLLWGEGDRGGRRLVGTVMLKNYMLKISNH